MNHQYHHDMQVSGSSSYPCFSRFKLFRRHSHQYQSSMYKTQYQIQHGSRL
jgi:hypothetical protein